MPKKPSDAEAIASGCLPPAEIRRRLPHRYPFLLVDRIIEKGETSLVAIKNVTASEPYFQGHFPQRPIVPGVLICESMAQASGLLAGLIAVEQLHCMLAGLEHVRFRKPVEPGDQLRLEIEMTKKHRPLWRFKGRALVGDDVVTTAELLLMEVPAEATGEDD